MTVYVDDTYLRARVGRIDARWCHMTADTDEELHAMAEAIGLKRSWAQHMDHPNQWHRHYDLTESRRAAAIAAGAVQITWRDAAQRSLAEGRRLREVANAPVVNIDGTEYALVLWGSDCARCEGVVSPGSSRCEDCGHEAERLYRLEPTAVDR